MPAHAEKSEITIAKASNNANIFFIKGSFLSAKVLIIISLALFVVKKNIRIVKMYMECYNLFGDIMYKEIRKTLREAAQRSYKQGLFAGTSGNLSIYDESLGVMAITPSSLSYEDMCDDDIVIMDLDGNKIEGERKPSSEYPMHAAIYKECREVSAVVHTHSPYATALAVANADIPVVLIEMIPYFGGGIKTAPFALPGTPELGLGAVEYLRQSGACLLANHGVLAVGSDLSKACSRAVYVEDAAKIYCIALQTGSVKIIDEKDIQDMKRIFG